MKGRTDAAALFTGRSVAGQTCAVRPHYVSSVDSLWQVVLEVALAANAILGLAYRVYRFTKKGPVADVVGQAILAALLLGLAAAVLQGQAWARWPALGYALLFAVIVMPVWTLGVLLPMRPRTIDYGFAVAYWVLLGVIVVAAVAG